MARHDLQRIHKAHQELDLSFNNITQIEGLDGLIKLTDLTLFNNRISKLKNMDDLVNLQVISIGNNNLVDLENVRIRILVASRLFLKAFISC